MPPIELEAERLQLTGPEQHLYAAAAALLARTYQDRLALHEPITKNQFAMLYLAYAVGVSDAAFLDHLGDVIATEQQRRRNAH